MRADSILEEGAVELWEVSLDDAGLQASPSILNAEELARASRFVQQIHRRRFVARRAILRTLLAGYLGRSPADIVFAFGPKGKPFLPGGELEMNLSHSSDRALFAFSKRPVGVDIERLRPMKDAGALADRFFSREEAAVLRSLTPDASNSSFFEVWTKKEAFVKAIGEGLSWPLSSFTVPLGEDEVWNPVRSNGKDQEWSIRRLQTSAGFAAALAVHGSGAAIRHRIWPDGGEAEP